MVHLKKHQSVVSESINFFLLGQNQRMAPLSLSPTAPTSMHVTSRRNKQQTATDKVQSSAIQAVGLVRKNTEEDDAQIGHHDQ